MFKTTHGLINLTRNLNRQQNLVAYRSINDLPSLLKKPSVIMCKDSKHILCYHPEPEHPFELTKPIERRIETESPLSTDLMNVYLKRFDNRIARNPDEHWVDALRLSKTFNEHPIIFRRANRNERKKEFLARTSPVKKNRSSI